MCCRQPRRERLRKTVSCRLQVVITSLRQPGGWLAVSEIRIPWTRDICLSMLHTLIVDKPCLVDVSPREVRSQSKLAKDMRV